MNAFQIRAARAMAQDRSIDTSNVSDEVLFGCALPDFKPVTVSMLVVVKLMRWQYCCMDGSWDEKLWNDEYWVYKKRIQVADMESAEVVDFLRSRVKGALLR